MNDNLINNIACPNCGTSNNPNTNFCIKCGTNLQQQPVNNNQNNNAGFQNVNTEQSNVNVSHEQSIPSQNFDSNVNNFQNDINQGSFENSIQSQEFNNSMNNGYNSQFVNNNEGNINSFQYILGSLIKPFDKFKNEENKLNSFKNTSILSLVVVGILTIIRLVTTMISEVRVTSFWTNEVKWELENLKEIQYFKVIAQNLLIYAGILLAIAGVYFLANLVIKKDAKFAKLLGATTTAFIPFAITSSVLAPLLSMIYVQLGICITVIGLVYTLVTFLELMNEIINIDNKNTRIYFHLICLSVIFIGGGLIAYKLILGSLTSGLGLLGSLF